MAVYPFNEKVSARDSSVQPSRSKDKGEKGERSVFKEQLKNGSVKMYQYLTNPSQKAFNSTQSLSKSPRSGTAQTSTQIAAAVSFMSEIKDKN